MAVIETKEKTLGNLVKRELWDDLGYCREAVELYNTTTEKWELGNVLGLTANGYVKYDPSGVDGSENVVGVLLANVDTIDGVVNAPVMVRGNAMLGKAALIANVTTEAEQEAMFAGLEALGLLPVNQIGFEAISGS